MKMKSLQKNKIPNYKLQEQTYELTEEAKVNVKEPLISETEAIKSIESQECRLQIGRNNCSGLLNC